MAGRRGASALAAMLVLLAGGCDGDPAPPRDQDVVLDAGQDKRGEDRLRHDLAPLTKRFAPLQTPDQVTWMSGTLGDSRVPGPSSYWIDAVITLAPSDVDQLVADHDPRPTTTRPDVVDRLTAELPNGPLLTSDTMDLVFSSEFSTQAWLDVDAGVLVLTAKGQ